MTTTINTVQVNEASNNQPTQSIKVTLPNGRRVKMFRGTTNAVAPNVYKALKDNPFSVDLPDQYLFNAQTDMIRPRNEFLNANSNELKAKYKDYFVSGSAVFPTIEGEEDNYAFQNYVATSSFTNSNVQGMQGFELAYRFTRKITDALKLHQGVEFNMSSKLMMDKTIDGQPTQSIQDVWVASPKKRFNRGMSKAQIKEAIGQMVGNLKANISNLETRGSGLKLVKVAKFFMNTVKYVPLSGGTYLKPPQYIANKYATINPINNAKHCPKCEEGQCQHCFLYAVMIGIRKEQVLTQDKGDLKHYAPHLDSTLDYSMLKFPVDANSSQIRQFEVANNLRINIMSCTDDEKPFTIRLSEHNDDPDRRTITLLLYTADRKLAGELFSGKKVHTQEVSHYFYVSSLSRLIGSSQNKHKATSHVCQYCLNSKHSPALLKIHEKHCRELGTTARIVMPKPGEKVGFKNFCRAYPAPIVAYCDFESFSSRPSFVLHQDDVQREGLRRPP